MKLPRRNAKDVEKMRAAARLASSVLEFIEPQVQPGISTLALNDLCHEFIVDAGAYPSPLNYNGFPKSICTSRNEVVCHGIPNDREVMLPTDIVNIDITVTLDGWFGDTSKTFVMPEVSPDVVALVERTQACLYRGIAAMCFEAEELAKPAGRRRYRRLNDIGRAIHAEADRHGYGVVRNFVGHGIGDAFHTPPNVIHYRSSQRGPALKPGNTFTIEPMINLGTHRNRTLSDGWTALTEDGLPSAQFEHTILVTEDGVEVLTARHEESDSPWMRYVDSVREDLK
ncbi:MAG: type I methionyl aminopeptidase [Myxococcales bacterium]|nr:type I methionyl aminopeptidase [Myxococcales bacterium]